jgi:hypothetical protein
MPTVLNRADVGRWMTIGAVAAIELFAAIALAAWGGGSKPTAVSQPTTSPTHEVKIQLQVPGHLGRRSQILPLSTERDGRLVDQ